MINNKKQINMPVILDPDAAEVLQAARDAGRPPYETLTPPEAREAYLKARETTQPEPPVMESVKAISLPSPAGAIPARIYAPLVARQADGAAIEGLFDGLAEDGALRLRLADGGVHVMHAGDVFLL